MEEKYQKVLPMNFKKLLSIQLKKYVKPERLVKVKNSFKISSIEKLKLTISEDLKNSKKELSPLPNQKFAEKVSRKGVKTKRLSQVKTPEGLKKPTATIRKTKVLTHFNTPEGLKKKMTKM
ncbi:histone H1-like [Humulus lupulus]|uniref:histone H1-like n=1 Tax=Humulus lupulus TaxID=3486 RepID=UPI002B401A1D|nr:histone H1-like [Humulus lupulus]